MNIRINFAGYNIIWLMLLLLFTLHSFPLFFSVLAGFVLGVIYVFIAAIVYTP